MSFQSCQAVTLYYVIAWHGKFCLCAFEMLAYYGPFATRLTAAHPAHVLGLIFFASIA
jgi:hypothetical protein